MSKKLDKQLNSEKKFIINPEEFAYINSLDTVGRSFEHYINSLKTEYIKMVSVRLGYRPEDTLEFSIDLKDPKREIKK